jgi:hypothetical protein
MKKESKEGEREINKRLTSLKGNVSYFADGNKRLNDEEIRCIKESEKKAKRTLEKTNSLRKENRPVFVTRCPHSSARCAPGHLISERPYFRCSVMSQT